MIEKHLKNKIYIILDIKSKENLEAKGIERILISRTVKKKSLVS